ncbi:beta-ketoacyl synthase N-terminal-like domain-containing protein [Streptomyces sp. NPDC087908]|uniref:beta-ketoacyl synthase N-terminal-like domain-containing protein n=1 Tax=Streptomyces sp. NPDC087908 TaxID=3365820 RepID=UPI0037FFBC36
MMTDGPDAADDTLCVSGMAWRTALGTNLDEVWRALMSGVTGVRELPVENRVSPIRNLLAAPFGSTAPQGGGRVRQVEVAVATARAALAHAGLPNDASDVTLVLGTSLGPHLDEPVDGTLYTWAEQTARGLGVTIPPVAVSTACSSGADAVAAAGALLRMGVAKSCLVGGIDLLTPGKRIGHSALRTMSRSLPRSFDADRDGMLLGEAAAFLVLERLADARARGARMHGILAGWGASNDAAGFTTPDAKGRSAAEAVRRSLALARVSAAQVAVVNAHGTGTPQNDAAEAACLRLLFDGLDQPPVTFATKGAFGHTLGATGVVEAITVLLALRDQRVPPVANLETVMSGFTLPLPRKVPMALQGKYGLSLTLGFGGFNTALLLSSCAAVMEEP